MEAFRVEQRGVGCFLVAEGEKNADIFRGMKHVYGKHCLGSTAVYYGVNVSDKADKQSSMHRD